MAWPQLRSKQVTFADVKTAVAENDKQRLAMKVASPGVSDASTDPRDWLIRANQGHSIVFESEALHEPVTLGNVPGTVVHGTYFAFWPEIVASGGLKPMGRNHVHCATGVPEEKGEGKVVSGMRGDAELLVYVDVEGALREGGMKWWLSENGVVLTEGGEGGVVGLKWFKEVRVRNPGKCGADVGDGVLWRDGEKVMDLPAGIKGKVPMGKGRVAGRDGKKDGKSREKKDWKRERTWKKDGEKDVKKNEEKDGEKDGKSS